MKIAIKDVCKNGECHSIEIVVSCCKECPHVIKVFGYRCRMISHKETIDNWMVIQKWCPLPDAQ